VFVALGGNIEPLVRLVQAAQRLKQAFPDIRFSSCYQNVAVGFVGDDFINAAARFTSMLSPAALSERLHAIEEQCGRRRDDAKWAPRAMDLDLLLIGDQIANEPGLRLPRADLTRRAYMLGPVAELAPDRHHPLMARSMIELWRELKPKTPPLRRIALDLNAV
jgi:2-amino-4-hydroxy-6-hydroxymethyldihydropteridine diphosphokinase